MRAELHVGPSRETFGRDGRHDPGRRRPVDRDFAVGTLYPETAHG